MAFISKRDLIESLNPLLITLSDQVERIQDLANELNEESLEEISDEITRTLGDIQAKIDEADD